MATAKSLRFDNFVRLSAWNFSFGNETPNRIVLSIGTRPKSALARAQGHGLCATWTSFARCHQHVPNRSHYELRLCDQKLMAAAAGDDLLADA